MCPVNLLCFLVFPWLSVSLMESTIVFPWLFLGLSSSLKTNKNIQALVKMHALLAETLRCTCLSGSFRTMILADIKKRKRNKRSGRVLKLCNSSRRLRYNSLKGPCKRPSEALQGPYKLYKSIRTIKES